MLLACLKARDAVGGIRARRELSVLDANVGGRLARAGAQEGQDGE